ncbi:MAG: F0F1 ATP synthase subunit B [Tenuifilaceae bacterium]|jgi:F-type H+-transporting ATPase subunit b|nr:F0F1 ATP synthase subunit B [Tenuifilaceae bacterium]
MGLITPDYGLLFWMLVSFSILLFLLKKFAWKQIIYSIKSREDEVAKALREAEYARNEVAQLQERQAKVVAKAQAERDSILAEAKKNKERIIEEANAKALHDSTKMIEQARETISREKEAAQHELKQYASNIILQATERILRSELKDKGKHEEQISSIINEISTQN